ncbi:MAG: response regulator [Planctomycetota bacterium]
MRLDAVRLPTFKDAVRVYLHHAWGDLEDSHWPRIDFESCNEQQVLEGFTDECKVGCMRKYSLRLGNRRYPFMKMIFQESLVRDSFFFAVDTHDELDIKETTPDYAEWLLIRDYNARIKGLVENEWRKSAIPTFHDILDDVDQAEVREADCCHQSQKPMVLVVDDDKDIAEGVRRILTRRGYEVVVKYSGEDAMESLKGRKPDLVLSDLEMGSGMTGIDFVRAIRADDDLKDIPFLLATAAGIDLSCYSHLDGFLVKPYEIEVLMTFVAKHLQVA